MAHSAEEEVARDFICFGEPDAVIVVCDATCLERNLNLVLQIMEAGRPVLLCVNLLDEARKKKIRLDLSLLSFRLRLPVAGTTARSSRGLDELLDELEQMLFSSPLSGRSSALPEASTPRVVYPEYIEEALSLLVPRLKRICSASGKKLPSARFIGARLLDANESLQASLKNYLGFDPAAIPEISGTLEEIRQMLEDRGISREQLHDDLASAFVRTAERVCKGVVFYPDEDCDKKDRKLDRIFTSRLTGFPIMLLGCLGFLAYHNRGELSLRPVVTAAVRAGGPAGPALFPGGRSCSADGCAASRCLPCYGLGHFRHAAAHGYFFPAFYIIGGFRLPSQSGF